MSKTYIAVGPSDLIASSSKHPDGSRFFRLPHSRTGQPALYVECPRGKDDEDGRECVLEVSSINPQRGRSWFIGDDQIVSDGSLLLYTPIDPFFLVVPMLLVLLSQIPPSPQASSSSSSSFFAQQLAAENKKSSRSRFLPLDDLVHEVASSSEYRLPKPFPSRKRKRVEVDQDEDDTATGTTGEGARDWNEDVVRLCELESVREAMKAVCEVQSFAHKQEDSANITSQDGTYYRPSATRMIEIIRRKIDAVSRALLTQHPEGGSDETTNTPFPTLVRQLARDGIDLEQLQTQSQSKDDELVTRQAAERVAIQVIGQWLPSVVVQSVTESYDSSALESYLDAQAAAQFAMSAASSLPTPPSSDAGAATAAAGKKGAAAKKGGNSRGVDTLKKVNTQKMPKLTSFFKKK